MKGLEKHGYDTSVVYSGREALDFLSRHSDIELIITDIMMPDMDGLELISRLNEDDNLKEIPIIVCSTLRERATVEEAMALGGADYIMKPFNFNEVLNKISAVMSKDE